MIQIDRALQMSDAIYIDVRSPKEFMEYHIPQAINIPLFTNEERAHIGVVHKEDGPEAARYLGLKYVSPKLSEITRQMRDLAQAGTLVVYCWRGGMRSQSICEILSLMDISHYRLEGGYKAFRKHVRSALAKPPQQMLIVLHGLTGVGKTEILSGLHKQGYPTIDIEGLANHRGSAFGQVGLCPQPSQKMFEGLLFWKLRSLSHKTYLFVECESRRTGKLFLPETFMQAMQDGKHILVYSSLQCRIDRIVDEYTGRNINISELEQSIAKLKKRLGKEKVKKLTEYLYQDKLSDLVAILLEDYYDPLYGYDDHPNDNYDVSVDSDDMNDALDEIKRYCNNL